MSSGEIINIGEISKAFNEGIKGLKLKTHKGGSAEGGEDSTSKEISPEWDKFKKDLDKLIADYMVAHPERKGGALRMKKSILENKSLKPVINRGDLDFSEIILNWAKSKSSKRKEEFVEFLNKNKNESQGVDDNSSKKDGDDIEDNSGADKIIGIEDEKGNNPEFSNSELKEKFIKFLEDFYIEFREKNPLIHYNSRLKENMQMYLGGFIAQQYPKFKFSKENNEIIDSAFSDFERKVAENNQELLKEDINKADSIEEIKRIVEQYGGVQGSQDFFTPEMITDTINTYVVRRKEVGYENRSAEEKENLAKVMTSAIRYKVMEILDKEDALNKESEKTKNKEDKTKKYGEKDYVEASYDKLHSSGVSDEDLKYFFNLPRKERDEILSLEGNKLAEALRNQKLKNAREKQDVLNEELLKNFNLDNEWKEKEDKERVLKVLSEQLQKSREEYLKKEDEVGIKISRLRNFFKNFVSVDKDYQIEKELEIYKENYERALKNYMEAIVELEGIEDSEEAEIMYRHAKFGETLSLMSAKEDLKFQKHPLWESIKKDLNVGSSDLVDKYSELLGRPKKWITEKTHSKVFGFGGGLVAVGGAMSFLTSNLPGIRALTVSMGVAVASKGFYKRAETKNVIEKEKELKIGSEELMRRITDLQGKIDQELIKRELDISLENIPESARKEVEDYYRRLGLSFVKGAALGATTYFGGQYLRESGLLGEGIETIKKSLGVWGASLDIEPISEMVIEDSEIKSPEGGLGEVGESQIKTSPHGADTHQGPIAPKTNLNPEVSDLVESKAEVPASELPEAPSEVESAPAQPESIESNLEQIKVIEGKGIKDSLAQFLAQNHEQLTEGKMGWDPEKYASVEEWSDKRAIGIVGELKEQYPDYNFDQVSTETEFQVDLSNKADIQVVGLEDKFNLGGNPESIEELKSSFEETGEGQAEKIEGNQDEVTAEEEGMTQNPTVEASETVGNNESETVLREEEKFREEVIGKIRETNPDFNLDESLSEIRNELRGGVFEVETNQSSAVNSAEAMMSMEEFYSKFVSRDLPELMKDDTGLGEIFRGINSIGKESAASQPEGGVFDIFRQTFSDFSENGNIVYNENGNVRGYVLRAVGNLYETGKLESFKSALRNIEIT